MKFDLSFDDQELHLKFEFENHDYDSYFEGFIELGSQLLPDDQARFWNQRKLVLIHDFITMFVQTKASEATSKQRVYVSINDRGMMCRFICIPGLHYQDLGACELLHECKMGKIMSLCKFCVPHEFCTMQLCEFCGKLSYDLSCCK